MNFALRPWQFFFIVLAGWVNHKQEVIDYLRTENHVLRQFHGKKRIWLNDHQRRRLAVKGKILGCKRLQEIGTVYTRYDPALAPNVGRQEVEKSPDPFSVPFASVIVEKAR